jgi:hypothetical protein
MSAFVAGSVDKKKKRVTQLKIHHNHDANCALEVLQKNVISEATVAVVTAVAVAVEGLTSSWLDERAL